MGSNTSKPLSEFSKEEVAALVRGYGGQFVQYVDRIVQNCVDGELLASMNVEEFLETLDELGVDFRLHRRKLLYEFRASLPELADTSVSSQSSRRSSKTEQSITDALNVKLASQSLKNLSLRHSLQTLEKERGRASAPPQEHATIVLTDVQNSTELWEKDQHAMRQALDLHDTIVRRICGEHHGYEIDTEGDAFFLAFHKGVEACGFALDLQRALNEAPWRKDILCTPWTCEDRSGRKGLRVKVAIHQGAVESRRNYVTGRTEYFGSTMDIAKGLEKLAIGGQTLLTSETWSGIFHLADTHLNSPRVTDIGNHVVGEVKGKRDTVSKRILELAPTSFSVGEQVTENAHLPITKEASLHPSVKARS